MSRIKKSTVIKAVKRNRLKFITKVANLRQREREQVPFEHYNVKYFYINLEQATVRKKSFEEEAAKHAMDIIRSPAIEGIGRKYPGDWGCKQSHLQLWRQIKENEIFVIFEDDISIKENKFEEILTQLPVDWHMCNFGRPVTHYKPAVEGSPVNPYFIKAKTCDKRGRNSGLWAYAIKGATIGKILKLYEKKESNTCCIDVWLRKNMDKFNCLFYTGPVVVRHGKVKNSNRQHIGSRHTPKQPAKRKKVKKRRK
jgi:GR25 family glycosyltransferase involved in LPS biosynthesis